MFAYQMAMTLGIIAHRFLSRSHEPPPPSPLFSQPAHTRERGKKAHSKALKLDTYALQRATTLNSALPNYSNCHSMLASNVTKPLRQQCVNRSDGTWCRVCDGLLRMRFVLKTKQFNYI